MFFKLMVLLKSKNLIMVVSVVLMLDYVVYVFDKLIVFKEKFRKVKVERNLVMILLMGQVCVNFFESFSIVFLKILDIMVRVK